MAYPNDWYETLVAAGASAVAGITMPNALIGAVYTQWSPNYRGALGQSLTLTVPTLDENNATDEGRGGITGIDPASSKVSIPIDHKYGSNRKIPIMDLALSPPELGRAYVKPVVEEVLRKVNKGIAADIVEANFPTNGKTVLGDDIITRAQLAKMWGLLAAQGVPTDDLPNLFFATHTTVVANMLGADDFVAENKVGIRQAEIGQQKALILPQYNMQVVHDPAMPKPTSTTYAALAFHRYAYGLRCTTPDMNDLNKEGAVATVVFPRPNVPVVLETWYEKKDQARYIHAYLMCGHKLVNEKMAAFGVTT